MVGCGALGKNRLGPELRRGRELHPGELEEHSRKLWVPAVSRLGPSVRREGEAVEGAGHKRPEQGGCAKDVGVCVCEGVRGP